MTSELVAFSNQNSAKERYDKVITAQLFEVISIELCMNMATSG